MVGKPRRATALGYERRSVSRDCSALGTLFYGHPSYVTDVLFCVSFLLYIFFIERDYNSDNRVNYIKSPTIAYNTFLKTFIGNSLLIS